MGHEGTIIRPPSEASSLILQVAVGCSHNACTFCPAYKKKSFRIKSLQEIKEDVDYAARTAVREVRRVFLCDGDPLGMPQDVLVEVLRYLRSTFPRLQRVGIYANALNILDKTVSQLRELRTLKLGIVYLGLESGDPETLRAIHKGATPEQMIKAARMVREAGMKLNVTVLLGIGGKERSLQHANETIRVLNAMQPQYVGALTVMVVPGTPLYQSMEKGDFELPDTFDLIRELRDMVQGSHLEHCLFFSNHASNYVPIQARLPKDKEDTLQALNHIIDERNEGVLRPEYLRGL